MATTHTYPPVGRCIYCGSTTTDLGKEHIIPFSLNGGLVLLDASCHDCEKKIQPYEMTVARRIFGHFRILHNVQTRNKKQRPTEVQIGTLHQNGKRGIAKISIQEHPTILILYKFSEATFLQGLLPNIEKNTWIPLVISGKAELEKFISKYHWDRQIKFFAVPIEFARMLAKIAYSYAIAEIGIDSFQPFPMTIDTILGRTNNVCHIVGGDLEIPPPDPAGKHILTIGCLIKHPNPLLIVSIRLFPAFETPQYHVVVGYFDHQNAQHVKTFSEKMRDAQEIFP